MAELPKRLSSNDVDVVRARATSDPTIESSSTSGGFEQVDRVVLTPSGVERREHSMVDHAGGEHSELTIRDLGAEQRLRLLKAEQAVSLVFGILDVLIGIRVVLKLIGANPANAFAHFIYSISALFLGPFFGLIRTPSSGGMVLEVSSIIAMIIYALIAWGIVRVLRLIFLRGTTRSVSTYDRYRS